jgi:threonine/homoserine/homoserine lactone efflux protein
MNVTSLLVFAAAYLAVVILPGPGVTALVARVLAQGTRGTPTFVAGFVTGSLMWFTLAAAGLAAVAATFDGLFVVIRYMGAGYLLYLAWKFWTATPKALATADASPHGNVRLFLAGLAINLGNPKAIIFFLALLPTVVDLEGLTMLGFAQLAMIIVAVIVTVMTAYTVAAVRARRLFTSPAAARLVNRGSSLAMASAAAAVAVR